MGKFIIHPEEAPNLSPTPPKFLLKRGDDCLNCGKCAALCIFEVHRRDPGDYRKMADPDSSKCKFCLYCIQECPQASLKMYPNPEYFKLGDEIYSPDNISTIIKEAETGSTPVSGGGYNGPFTGQGFDSFWTDMSEIVRPTRDGIHAREYISTAVDIGRKPPDINFLKFDKEGNPLVNIPPSVEINLPIIFDYATLPLQSENLALAVARAAAELGTLAILPKATLTPAVRHFSYYLIESFNPEQLPWGELAEIARKNSIIELLYTPEISELPQSLKKINPELVILVRLQEPQEVEKAVREIYRSGADVIHLHSNLHLPKLIRSAHQALVADAIRDQITLIASGAIAEAAHIPKAIILGADAVAIDLPLLMAMGCLLCKDCYDGKPCPRELAGIAPEWGKSRIKNLMVSWHNQLLEILGAMGMREVSRLRGEVGRAIFFEDLEKELITDLEKANSREQIRQ